MTRWMVLAVGCVAGSQAAMGGQIVATVTGVRDDRGTLRLAICTREEFLKPVCRYSGKAAAQAGSVVVTIDGVPPGTYAAQAFQDANDNGVIDRNWFGVPVEGLGFSNDAAFRFGPPRFADAAFSLPAAGGAISFRLRYY